MATVKLDTPVQYVKGVGPRNAAALATLDIHTVDDLLHYFPFRHEHDSGEIHIAEIRPNANVTIRGEVVDISRRGDAKRCEIYDGTGYCTLRWFHESHTARKVFRGATIIASGRVQLYNELPELVQPRVQVFEPEARLADPQRGARNVGVYSGNKKAPSSLIRRAALNLLSLPELPVTDDLPPELRKKHDLPEREDAIRQMHAPTSEDALERARRRLAYEELFIMELALALRRRKRLARQDASRLPITAEIDRRIRTRFPFKLTDAQDGALREIVRDLASGRPMTRLLQGDVGSGKTVVALYACLVAIANGRQAAIMAPTEILAQQHYNNIARYLADSRVRPVLLRGKLASKERGAALAAIERGDIDLVVGTQALIQQDVAFNQLGLVVVDEQHKFGVVQRHVFRTKGPMPHYLVMTATPIPRTLAMTVFGDLDVSLIRHSPPGRGRIVTRLVRAGQWPTVMSYVRQRLEAGEQAYVVCPLVGGDEDDVECRQEAARDPHAAATRENTRRRALVSATDMHDRLRNGPFRGLHVGLLHGSLPPAEKTATIEAFAAGRLHAVVATTVVEVGVDVPNATIMVIENADRFGLSQLHQLRGRVGRGSQDSLCVLVSRSRSPKAAERLNVMTTTTDGFKIAEADLRQRGPGDLFGTRQHGLPALRVASIVDDFELLSEARQDAFELAQADPALQAPDHRRLLPALQRMLGEKLALIDAG